MAWEKMHRTVGSNGEVTMSPGYYEETVTLGNNADASTSALDFPIKSDITILATFSADLTGDTYINNGIFWLYELDSNCKGLFTRFTVKANGGNESAKTCKFQLISHF